MGPKVEAALAFGGGARSSRRSSGCARASRARRARGAMTERVIVRRGAYYDSVTLMLVSRAAGETSVGMATPLNLELLRRPGLRDRRDVGPNDLVIAVRADDVDAVVAAVERELAAKGGAVRRGRARRRALARRRRPARPRAQPRRSSRSRATTWRTRRGRAGGRPARVLLLRRREPRGRGSLKRQALERGLLFMGADCGTAIIDGVALGFANAVQRGPVGIVGASGHRHPGGLLPARRRRRRGVARDRRRRPRPVGRGRRADDAARPRAAGADEETRVIVAVSSRPTRRWRRRSRRRRRPGKPVVLGFRRPR